VQAVAAIRGGDLRAEAYARALLDRCEQLKDLNAFISLSADAVLEAARSADQRRTQGAPLGALFGLPVPLKDSICTTALPTTSGTRSLHDFHPVADAAVWQRLSQADAILLGKL
jgi:indoleacetamide hydrolase